jgi:CRISPR-associated protein Cas5d
MKKTVTYDTWGDLGCFTQPSLKAERFTYPVITPSAARGLTESIFWKPEIFWRVRKIEVMSPIRYTSMKRNEIGHKFDKADLENGYIMLADENRVQRNTLCVVEPYYRITVEVELRGDQPEENVIKYREQLVRRISRGSCYKRPFFGCREFVAEFSEPDPSRTPIGEDAHFGTMLFDIVRDEDGKALDVLTFDAIMEGGVITVPQEQYGEMVR